MNLSSYPHLVKEWHPTKNGDLTPNDFTHATRKKVWWLCTEGHSFETEVRIISNIVRILAILATVALIKEISKMQQVEGILKLVGCWE